VRPAIDPHLIQFSYVLHDLSEISDDELHTGATRTALARLAAMCFKHARTRTDLLQILAHWIDLVREVAGAPNGLEALARVMRYILEVSEHVEPAALEALLERGVGPEAKDTIVTAGQRLIEQGRQQGIEQGRKQGLQQGILQGQQEFLLDLLRDRFGDEVDARVERRVATATSEQIDTWRVRLKAATTLAEVLVD
jgi:hypothetical protein